MLSTLTKDRRVSEDAFGGALAFIGEISWGDKSRRSGGGGTLEACAVFGGSEKNGGGTLL